VQNSLCVPVLHSPMLAALLHGTRAVGISQSLRRGTRNRITELSVLILTITASLPCFVYVSLVVAENVSPSFPHLYSAG